MNDRQKKSSFKPTFINERPQDTPDPNAKVRKLVKGDDGKWNEMRPSGSVEAHGAYNFVVRDGEILAIKEGLSTSQWGHVDIAGGENVTWAGRIEFEKDGRLKEWDNGSGHYTPSAGFAKNAGLPLDKFIKHERDGTAIQLPVFEQKRLDRGRRR